MKLSDVIRISRNTVLKQFSKNDKTDEVIVDYINLTLLDLYSKFTLDTAEAIINLVATKTEYSLDGTDLDVSMPDSREILQIEEAYDEKGRIHINDDVLDSSIYTIAYDKVQVPVTADGARISIIYKPTPEEVVFVDSGNGVATESEIRLPKALLDVVVKGVGYFAFEALEGTGELGNAALLKYERACSLAEERGVVPRAGSARNIKDGGFV